MAEATLSSKNQIVIPREAREALGLKPGDKILVVVRGERRLVLQKPNLTRPRLAGWLAVSIREAICKRNARVGDRTAPKFLRRHSKIALDTSVFIYQRNQAPDISFCTDSIFSWLEQPGDEAITSTITMTELLVLPYREGDEQRVANFYACSLPFPT